MVRSELSSSVLSSQGVLSGLEVRHGDGVAAAENAVVVPERGVAVGTTPFDHLMDAFLGFVAEVLGQPDGVHINIYAALTGAVMNNWDALGKILCHEMGHTVGLRHNMSQVSCMDTVTRTTWTPWLTAHDVSHLNATY